MKKRVVVTGVIGLVLISIVIFIRGFCLTHVSEGNVGVIVNFSQVDTESYYSEGWYWKNPFGTRVIKMSVRNTELALPETQGELSGKEVIYMELKLIYSLDPTKAAEIYQKAGKDYIKTIMSNEEVFDIVKGVVAQYSIDEFASKRQDIMYEAKETLNAILNERGITVETLSLSDYHFTEAIEAAIDAMNEASMASKTAGITNQNAIDKAEADKTVASLNAEAKALEITTKATAEAAATIAAAEAEAEANRLISGSITDELKEWKKIEAWDGVAIPKVVTGSDGKTILDVGDVIE